MSSIGKVKPGQIQKNVEKIIITSEEEIEKKLSESLKRLELPDYLLYTGAEGAQNWLKLNGSGIFPVALQLKGLLEKNIVLIVKFIPTCMSLVSIGVGGGDKEKIILEELIKKNLAKKPASDRVSITYYPIDISSQLVDIALEKTSGMPVEKKGIVGFIEEMPLLKRFWRFPVLFCILGNTFCNYDPEFILKLVHDNLEIGDLFLFDADLLLIRRPGEETKYARNSILGIYASRENAFFNMYPLLQYGMSPKDFDFELMLVDVDSRIGKVYRTRKNLNIMKDAKIEIGKETISFKEGDIIRMGFTYKYTYEQIITLLNICRFDVLNSFLNENKSNAIILAKKCI